MDDLISRQMAIASAISGRVRTLPTSEDGEDWIRTSEVRESLLNLPSVQPEPSDVARDIATIIENEKDMRVIASERKEPLTDKEQRIFLAAMEREEKVCKEVDEECRDCREPYEDSLVKTCHEITRKVKDALWMI